jgi:hypothetical protein
MIHSPPPWNLRGDGYILLYRFSAQTQLGGQAGFVPPELQPHFRGGLGAVMLVDYKDTPVGPYHELLFIPGFFDFHGQSFPSISKIYVSTWASIVNGRENWRIPKEEAQFASYQRGNVERIRIQQPDGSLIADITLEMSRWRFPITTGVVPPALRTVVQNDPIKSYEITLAGQGWAQPTHLHHVRVDPTYFPDFTQGQLLTAVRVSNFSLTFPVPQFGPPVT